MNQRGYCSTFASLVAILLVGMLFAPAAAALPPRPDPDPEPTPTHVPLPNGAIQLTVSFAPTDLWTVVQWQDALGGWHDVTGWQGTLDDGTKTWWVDETHYGKGPFRWALTQSGELLAASDSFSLPEANGQVVRIAVSLAP